MSGPDNHPESSANGASAPNGMRKQEHAHEGATGAAVPRANRMRPGVSEALANRPRSEWLELHQFWAGGSGSTPASAEAELKARVRACMLDAAVVEARVRSLGKRLGAVVEVLLHAPHYQCSLAELSGARALAYLSSYDFEACLQALERRALVTEGHDQRFARFGERVLCLPQEIGDALLRQRRARENGVFDLLTLRGMLDRSYSDPPNAARFSPQRLRELYKMYAGDSAAVQRIEHLSEGLRQLVERAILEFGGLLPRGLFERMEHPLLNWNAPAWKEELEKSLVGTVTLLELSRYGIAHNDETLIVFNEVALAWLRRVAVPGDPDRPHEELSLGVDQVTNLSRLLAFIQENDVRFTVRGEIFKTTEKKILQQLIPNPGRELSREAVLGFLYGFARHAGLFDRTGERTLAITSAGRDWSEKPLTEKLEALLNHSIEERSLGGEAFHQIRLRQIFMRLLKRIEPGTWYDLMYLPFLARNNYLSSLDELAVETVFAERNGAHSTTPLEDPQRLAWNLVRWVRQRLYLLGLIDLGYDKSGRPVAMRLTRSGARLVGASLDAPGGERGLGNLVVTPDFEVVLFPTGDDTQLVHDLDRFCEREKLGALMHFRISEYSVRRALSQGMHLARIEHALDAHSRTPVPQNVCFSIRDWAQRAGLMTLDAHFVLRSGDPEGLRRFLADPGARAHVREQLDERCVALKGRFTARRMQSLLRDLGFLVELV